MTSADAISQNIPVSAVAAVDRQLEQQAADSGTASTITTEVTGVINSLIRERVRLMTPPALSRLKEMVANPR